MDVQVGGVSRPALRYHGSKWLLAPWIIGNLPGHECYVEPYGGAAGVLLRKPRSWHEVYNDRDSEVVNFFRVLREDTEELIRQIELTPFAKAEWELAYEEAPAGDLVERARRFYVRSFQNIAGPTARWQGGWRRQKVITKQDGAKRMTPAARALMRVRHLWEVANRFRGVQVECDEALAVMERYDSEHTLFYLDPPYVASTRGRWKNKAYGHEMTDEDHEELAGVVGDVRGMVVISGYRCALYDELYGDWKRLDKVARVNGEGSRVESLWLSPKAEARSLPLFADLVGGG